MQDQPIADKIAVAVGTLTTGAITFEWLQGAMAVIAGVLTLILLGYRVALARREWREGRKSSD